MHVSNHTLWAPEDFCLTVPSSSLDLRLVAEATYDLVCRTDIDAPGFALLDLGVRSSSEILRTFMIQLKTSLRSIHQERSELDLVMVSAGRFDQQTATKAHRDGGPDQSLLMLGYEPSSVDSEIFISDYSRCADEMGISTEQFLKQHNPMFREGEAMLEPYTSRVTCFSNSQFQILLINNSVASATSSASAWQGLLHTARILNPAPSQSRVVNSMMLAAIPVGGEEPVSQEAQMEFVTTHTVRKPTYGG